MKHIKKKLLQTPQVLPSDTYEYVTNVNAAPEEDINRIYNNFSNYYSLIITDQKQIVKAFNYEDKETGLKLTIPEPHPIVLYFNQAQVFLRALKESKETIIKSQNENPNKSLDHFYVYFMHASSFVVFLFTSIESFSNHLIPEDYLYNRQTKERLEVYNKSQILDNISFDEKIKKILPDINKNSFHELHGHLFEHLVKLKKFRDEIIHTKPYHNSKQFYYEDLFTWALDFKYGETIIAAKEFINFYEPNLIEECDCGGNY